MFDAELFSAGDREHVRAVVQEYAPVVLLVCQAYARDYDHAEDLYQETWRTVCEKARSFRGSGSFKAWLHRIATNVCLTDLRASKAASEAMGRFAREATRVGHGWSTVDPLVDTERREMHRAIHRALPKLTDGQREALVLRVLEGRDAQEVASIMGVELATVRSHVRHALERLREMMEDPDHELSRYRTGP